MSEYKTRSIQELLGSGDTLVTDTFRSIKAYNDIVDSLQNRAWMKEARNITASNYVVGRIDTSKTEINNAMASGDSTLSMKLMDTFQDRFGNMQTDDPNIRQHYVSAKIQNERHIEKFNILEQARNFIVQNNTDNSTRDWEFYKSLDADELSGELERNMKNVQMYRKELNEAGMSQGGQSYAWIHSAIDQLEKDSEAIKVIAAGDKEIGNLPMYDKLWINYKQSSSGTLQSPEDALSPCPIDTII